MLLASTSTSLLYINEVTNSSNFIQFYDTLIVCSDEARPFTADASVSSLTSPKGQIDLESTVDGRESPVYLDALSRILRCHIDAYLYVFVFTNFMNG